MHGNVNVKFIWIHTNKKNLTHAMCLQISSSFQDTQMTSYYLYIDYTKQELRKKYVTEVHQYLF